MLKKLLKYEFQATSKSFLPLYGALIVLALIQRIFISLNFYGSGGEILEQKNFFLNFLSITFPMLFGITVVAIVILTFVILIQRFYKNLLGNEGYLMFTLPVKTSSLIWSKAITMTVWCTLSAIVGIIAFIILFANSNTINSFKDLMNAFVVFWNQNMPENIKANIPLFIIELIIVIFSNILAEILTIYASLSIGHLAQKHRIVFSFCAFVVINIALTMIVTGTLTIFESLNITLPQNLLDSPVGVTHASLLGFSALGIIQCVIFFLITKFVLEKRLNLE